jgi:hypothetical protein
VKEWGYLSKSNVGEITPPEVMQGDIIPVFIKSNVYSTKLKNYISGEITLGFIKSCSKF